MPDIVTATKKPFNISTCVAEDFYIEDIAHALAHICRFGGHIKQFYSVAQHSVYVSRLLPRKYALFGLMHDASEAYIGDIITPLKRMLSPLYSPIEQKMMWLIAKRFKFDMSQEAEDTVKQADLAMLATEIRDLVSKPELYSPPVQPREGKLIYLWEPKQAFDEFMNEFYYLRMPGTSQKLREYAVRIKGWHIGRAA